MTHQPVTPGSDPEPLTAERLAEIRAERYQVRPLAEADIAIDDLLMEVARLKADRDALEARLSVVLDICDREQRNAIRWENPIPVPEWVAPVQRAALGDDKRAGAQDGGVR